MMKLLSNSPAKSNPSNASPPLREPSPITAIIFSVSFFKSLAFAKPEARLTDVEVWPILNISCSLSSGFV